MNVMPDHRTADLCVRDVHNFDVESLFAESQTFLGISHQFHPSCVQHKFDISVSFIITCHHFGIASLARSL